jgi:hypothetical protein
MLAYRLVQLSDVNVVAGDLAQFWGSLHLEPSRVAEHASRILKGVELLKSS